MLSIQSRRHGSSGFQRVVSNEGDGNLLPLFIGRTVSVGEGGIR
jgi:hypothetical protein